MGNAGKAAHTSFRETGRPINLGEAMALGARGAPRTAGTRATPQGQADLGPFARFAFTSANGRTGVPGRRARKMAQEEKQQRGSLRGRLPALMLDRESMDAMDVAARCKEAVMAW